MVRFVLLGLYKDWQLVVYTNVAFANLCRLKVLGHM